MLCLFTYVMNFKSKPILSCLLCIFAASILVLFLVVLSGNATSLKNGFKRKFFNSVIQPLHYTQKEKTVRAICGIQYNHIYFETGIAGVIVETDSTLLHTRILKFDLPDIETVQTLFTTFVDSSNCYIMAGNVPEVIQINLHSKSLTAFHLPNHLFSESVFTGRSEYVIRTYEKVSNKWEQIFIKVNPVKNTVTKEDNISEKRGDAGFSTDGHLAFDESARCIAYTEYYRNHFISMDTSLHLLYSANTIDTFKNTTVTVAWDKTNQFEDVTNGSPLHEINLESKALAGNLYIHSAVKSDDETSKAFAHHAVIDVYRITNGRYRGSFYIPEFKEERMKEFEVATNKIVVLYDNYVVIYSNPFSFNDGSI